MERVERRMSKISTFLGKLFYPYSGILKEIKESHHHQLAITRRNIKKINNMKATLDGEEFWMSHRAVKEKDDCSGF